MTTKHLTRKVNELIAVLYEIKADIAGFEPNLDHPFYPDVYKMIVYKEILFFNIMLMC